MELKEREKHDKYMNSAREQKKLNMKVMVIPFVIRAHWTVSKNMEKRMRWLEIIVRSETIQTAGPL